MWLESDATQMPDKKHGLRSMALCSLGYLVRKLLEIIFHENSRLLFVISWRLAVGAALFGAISLANLGRSNLPKQGEMLSGDFDVCQLSGYYSGRRCLVAVFIFCSKRQHNRRHHSNHSDQINGRETARNSVLLLFLSVR